MIDQPDRNPDPADVASLQEEQARQSARITSRRPDGPKATGYCLHCDELLAPTSRWCCADHRDQWEKEQRR
jgi:hypothetical protein